MPKGEGGSFSIKKNYIAEFGSFKQGFLSMKLISDDVIYEQPLRIGARTQYILRACMVIRGSKPTLVP